MPDNLAFEEIPFDKIISKNYTVNKSVNENSKNEVKDEGSRDTWGNNLQFLMSCISMSVGLGNVWRFPFTAYENGGGAFLVPYLIVLILVGRPIYYMEMCLGQFTSRGHVKTFESLAPAMKGVGVGQLFACICVGSYYCSLLALTLFYLLNSFTTDLPWTACDPKWDDEKVHCLPSGSYNISNLSLGNYSTSSDLWFTKEVLKEKPSIEDGLGWPEWRLTCLLFLSWLMVFVVSAKGIKSSGKASYFLAIFPYVILLALLIRAVTLKGSTKGVLYFLKPDWEKLLEAKVWFNAVTQCFFSLNIGSGCIVMYASYNDFRYNVYRDALIVTSMDTFTSLLSGITIFGILGNLAHELGVEVTEVITSGGARLAFVSYPDAISKFDAVPWLFAILFFLMLFVLGIGSLVAGQACIYTAIKDTFPNFRHWHVSLVIVIIGFLTGLAYVTPGGQFALTLVDYFGATFILFVLTTVEVLFVCWWYGFRNLCLDIEFMLERRMGIYWKICWGLVTPVVLISIFVYFLSSLQRLKNGIHEFSDLALNIGWCLLALGLSQPLIWWVFYLYKKRKDGFCKVLLNSFTFEDWGPSDHSINEEWRSFRSQRQQT